MPLLRNVARGLRRLFRNEQLTGSWIRSFVGTGRFSCGLLVSLVLLSGSSSIWGEGGPIDSSTDRGGLDRNPRVVSPEVPTDGAPDDPKISAIDELARDALAKKSTGSLTIGIVTSGRLSWSKSYGYADMEQKIPASADNIYRIASITKQFTALMLLQLVQDGKVNLSDPVEKYFPEVNLVKGRFFSAPPITLVQLATHTSGLAGDPEDNRKYMVGPVADWEKTTIEALKNTRYVFEPGTKFGYSNLGYAVLAATLSRAARQPYTEYVRQHIWEPLGMTQTTFEPDPGMRAKIAKGYHLRGNGQVEEGIADRLQYHGYEVPAGSVFTTVGDLAKFVVFELGGGPSTVLQPKTLEQNFQRIITTNENFTSGYAVGYEVNRRCNSVYFGHQGGMWGYVADAFFHLSSKTGVIVLRNASGDDFDDEEFTWSVFDILAGRSGAAQALVK